MLTCKSLLPLNMTSVLYPSIGHGAMKQDTPSIACHLLHTLSPGMFISWGFWRLWWLLGPVFVQGPVRARTGQDWLCGLVPEHTDSSSAGGLHRKPLPALHRIKSTGQTSFMSCFGVTMWAPPIMTPQYRLHSIVRVSVHILNTRNWSGSTHQMNIIIHRTVNYYKRKETQYG